MSGLAFWINKESTTTGQRVNLYNVTGKVVMYCARSVTFQCGSTKQLPFSRDVKKSKQTNLIPLN